MGNKKANALFCDTLQRALEYPNKIIPRIRKCKFCFKVEKNSKSIKIIGAVVIACILGVFALNSYLNTPHGAEEKLVKELVDEAKEDLLPGQILEIEQCYTYYLDSSLEAYNPLAAGNNMLAEYDNQLWCKFSYANVDSDGRSFYTYFYKVLENGEFVQDSYSPDDNYYNGLLMEYAEECVKLYPENQKKFNFKDLTEKANKWAQ